jgi:pyrroline-5-carboxylate reductase
MARKPHSLKSLGSLVLLGAGKMGGAMLEGWIARGLEPSRITIIEPQPAKALKALTRHGLNLNPKGKATTASVVVVAVKPQTAPEAVPALAPYVGKTTLLLSIMAGRTIAFIESALPAASAVVRAIPNTPAAIGRGITVAVGNGEVSARQRRHATDLLASLGAVEWVSDEGLMDAVTATSGSGPAYVFLLAEAMTQGAIAAGIPPALAARLARETIAGAGELLRRSELDPTTLRQNVTSPGGTTAAALGVLMGPGGFDTLLTQAIAAATKRGRELAG